MSSRDLETKYARQYKFRPRGHQETRGRYREALIKHVRERDFSAAHEILVGRPQAEWSREDVERFRATLEATPHPRLDNPPPVVDTFKVGYVEVGTQEEVDAAMLEMGHRGLAAFLETRTNDPTKELVLLLTMLLANGELHVAPVRRGDRVAILKAFAQQCAMIGFTVATDAFIHRLDQADTPHPVASKTDAIMVHVGTHTSRWMLVRPYRIVDGVVVVEDPPPPDLNIYALDGGARVDDPYAEVMCSVPMPTGKPS